MKNESICSVCHGQGIVSSGSGAHAMTGPCKACGANHGYVQHIRLMYSNPEKLPSGIHIQDNIYGLNQFKMELRQIRLEQGTGQHRPHKSDGNNILIFEEKHGKNKV